MHKSKQSVTILLAGLLLAHAAQAYVGPGAGLSLLGALWALVVAIAAAVVFLFAWPIRRMRRRRREAMQGREQTTDREQDDTAGEARAAEGPPPATRPQETRESGTP